MVEKIVTAFVTFLLLYVLLPEVTFLFLIFAIFTKDILWISVAILYVIVLFYIITFKVHYDAERLEGIYIEEAPHSINRLLSETTNQGVLINQLIIETIARKRMISQTELYEELRQLIGPRLCPVKEMVRRYMKKLEDEKIIKDVSHEVVQARKKAYVLSKRGKWCFDAIKKYYPNYLFIYLIRCMVRTRFRKKLPLFESVELEE